MRFGGMTHSRSVLGANAIVLGALLLHSISVAEVPKLEGKLQGVKPHDRAVLVGLLKTAGIERAAVSSAERSVERQARIMYKAARSSIEDAKALYCSAGDKVLDAYDPNASEQKNLRAMTDELRARLAEARELGCLNHVENPEVYAVDIAASSVPEARRAALIKAGLRAIKRGRIVRFFYPPHDRESFHFEFSKKQPTAERKPPS